MRQVLQSTLGRQYYLIMSVIVTLIVIYGFSQDINPRLFHPPHPVPVELWVHSAIFTLWIILLLVQTSLIRSRQPNAHRLLGLGSLALGVMMPISGSWTAVLRDRGLVQHGHPAGVQALAILLSLMLYFSVMYGLAIHWSKRPEYHKRLMLMSVIVLSFGGFSRFPITIISQSALFMPDVLILCGVARDWLVQRRVHIVYRVGLPALVLAQCITLYISKSSWWAQEFQYYVMR